MSCFSPIPLLIPLLEGTTLIPNSPPARGWPSALAGNFACLFHFAQHRPDPFPAHTRTGPLDVAETKIRNLSYDRVAHHRRLGAARLCRLADTILKFLVR